MDKVGRYQILAEIGHGAMARVYKAHDPEIDRTLAIKLLQPELSSDAEHRQRFVREAIGSGMLTHSNIVTVLDVGEDEKRPYVATEWTEGPKNSAYLMEKKACQQRKWKGFHYGQPLKRQASTASPGSQSLSSVAPLL